MKNRYKTLSIISNVHKNGIIHHFKLKRANKNNFELYMNECIKVGRSKFMFLILL